MQLALHAQYTVNRVSPAAHRPQMYGTAACLPHLCSAVLLTSSPPESLNIEGDYLRRMLEVGIGHAACWLDRILAAPKEQHQQLTGIPGAQATRRAWVSAEIFQAGCTLTSIPLHMSSADCHWRRAAPGTAIPFTQQSESKGAPAGHSPWASAGTPCPQW